ncbi:MAG TPA: hypothetical protein VHT29_14660 [Solirubrobacteraceae bacterium]|jgi:hypothetical protein|nr:hypothetical protein [Solirubrobacteraceae bacterium]
MSLTTSVAVLVACMACLALLPAAIAAAAEPTIKYAPESFAQYQKQLNEGKIKAVTINKRVRSLRVTLGDGSYVLAKYAAHEESKIDAALHAKGVQVTILKPAEAAKEVKKAPVKHKLRYIAGGIVVVVVIVVGLVLFVDRKRKLERE